MVWLNRYFYSLLFHPFSQLQDKKQGDDRQNSVGERIRNIVVRQEP